MAVGCSPHLQYKPCGRFAKPLSKISQVAPAFGSTISPQLSGGISTLCLAKALFGAVAAAAVAAAGCRGLGRRALAGPGRTATMGMCVLPALHTRGPSWTMN